MARIAVAGFQHETNTFASVKADYEAFERQDGWPALSRGDSLFDAIDGVHLPITGAVTALRRRRHQVVPLLWCSAVPCAHVTDDAFERIAGMIVEDLRRADPLDGVLLDLHGAMVTETLDDGEGELLRQVRAVVGPDLPIAVSLDLHANVTEAMVDEASVIDLFRAYPHVDMGETGARTAGHLMALVDGARWHKALRRPDFLIPVNWGCTLIQPANALYGEMLPELIAGDVRAVGLAMGFPLADIAECGPAVVAYGTDQAAADQAADILVAEVAANEHRFAGRIYPADAAVAYAREMAKKSNGPIVIADTQDNPGGGGPGDTTGMLRALLHGGADGAVIGVFNDPQSAARAHEAGEGAKVQMALGGKLFPGDSPVESEVRVLKLGDGQFVGTGPMWHGARFALGPMALVEIAGVRVAIASQAMQAGDRSMFRHLGVEPGEEHILVLKSSVHFRADFQPIAAEVITAAAPGPCFADVQDLDFQRLRPDVRRAPRSLE